MDARGKKAHALRLRFSQSFASLRAPVEPDRRAFDQPSTCRPSGASYILPSSHKSIAGLVKSDRIVLERHVAAFGRYGKSGAGTHLA
jgi:hypothetical protein